MGDENVGHEAPSDAPLALRKGDGCDPCREGFTTLPTQSLLLSAAQNKTEATQHRLVEELPKDSFEKILYKGVNGRSAASELAENIMALFNTCPEEDTSNMSEEFCMFVLHVERLPTLSCASPAAGAP